MAVTPTLITVHSPSNRFQRNTEALPFEQLPLRQASLHVDGRTSRAKEKATKGNKMTQQRTPSAFATTVLAIPIVNFIGQFFVSSPSFEQVERTLSMLGLVSALVLAVAYSLPGTVSYDELRAADQRFGFSIDDDLSAPNSTTTSHMATWYHDSAFGGSKPPSFNYGYFLAIACYTLTVVSAPWCSRSGSGSTGV